MHCHKLGSTRYHQILPITADKLHERSNDLYDVVILGDVIEHMLHAQGRDLLEFLNYRSRYLIVSAPEWDMTTGRGPVWPRW